MKDNSNFFDLLKYSPTGYLDSYNIVHAHRELDFYLSHCNDSSYDIIDYEQIIYIEMRFGNDDKIHSKLEELKRNICKNYINRQKLINKFL